MSNLSLDRSERYLVILYDQAMWCDLRDGVVANALHNQLERVEHEGVAKIICSNVLSDCIQILVEVDVDGDLGLFLDRFRRLSWDWVEWRHEASTYRLGEADILKDFAYYVFMGPYRQGLLDVDERNVFWRSWSEDKLLDFGETTDLSSFEGGSLRRLMTVESTVEQVIVAV